MAMPITFTSSTRVPAVDLLVVPVASGGVVGDGADLLDEALDGGLAAFLAEAAFDGKRGDFLPVPTHGRIPAKAAVLLGVGDPETFDAAQVRRAGALVARRAAKVKSVATTLLSAAPDLGAEDAARALAEGAGLGAYQFLRYKSDGTASALRRFVVVGRGGARVNAALERGARVAEAVCWARDLVNEPASAKSPEHIAAVARKVGRAAGLKVTVLAGEQLARERMGGVIGVGGGSSRPPRFVRMEYAPRAANATLAFVGKGVVFDSGGLSLKTAGGMETMKTDMSGAAAVIATMAALRDLGVRNRVVGYVPLVENMPGGRAMRPGDVLHMRNGKTVEVLNTDAEGRLILADALSMAADERPDVVVDLATLTGAVTVALGEKIAGLMGNDDAWIAEVQAAADRAGERVWHLPLPDDYRRTLDSEIADLRNISTGGGGGTLTAALFLREFVDGHAWVHLDIAGTARASADDAEISKGGTGYGVRTLLELAEHFTPRNSPRTRRPASAKKAPAKKAPLKKAPAKKGTKR